MRNATEDQFNPYEPYLIVVNGSTSKKHRPLNRDVVTLGKAPGCDIGLDARDVAELHCVVYRVPAGFRVRNYARRGNTRVNGEIVQEAQLKDGDCLQISLFSFRVHLPTCYTAEAGDLAADQSRLRRLERSRRRLAQRALKQRRQLQQGQAGPSITTMLAPAAAAGAGIEPAKTTPLIEIFPDEARALRIRSRELESYARHLQKQRQQLAAASAPAASAQAGQAEKAEAVLRERLEDFEREKERWQLERDSSTTLLDRRREELSRDEALLGEWKQQMEMLEKEHHEDTAGLERRRTELDHGQSSLEEQRRALERQRDEVRLIEEVCERREQELRASEAELQNRQLGLDGSIEELRALEASLTSKQEELHNSETAVGDELQRGREQLAAERTAWQRQRDEELRRSETALGGEVQRLEREREQLAAERTAWQRQRDEELRRHETTVGDELDRLEREREQLAAEKTAWQRQQDEEAIRLQARRDQLAQQEAELLGKCEHLEPQQKQHATAALELARQADRIARADAVLRQRRQELSQMMVELRQAHQVLLNRRSTRQSALLQREVVEA